MSPTEEEYRRALYQAQGALLHASKWVGGEEGSAQYLAKQVIDATLADVSRVLDIGRDESKEQIAT